MSGISVCDENLVSYEDVACFYCKYYHHLNLDDDVCALTGRLIFFDTPICDDFLHYAYKFPIDK